MLVINVKFIFLQSDMAFNDCLSSDCLLLTAKQPGNNISLLFGCFS